MLCKDGESDSEGVLWVLSRLDSLYMLPLMLSFSTELFCCFLLVLLLE